MHPLRSFQARSAEALRKVVFLVLRVSTLPLQNRGRQPQVAVLKLAKFFGILHQALGVSQVDEKVSVPGVHLVDERLVRVLPDGLVEKSLAGAAAQLVAEKLEVKGEGVLPVTAKVDHPAHEVAVVLGETLVEFVIADRLGAAKNSRIHFLFTVFEDRLAHCPSEAVVTERKQTARGAEQARVACCSSSRASQRAGELKKMGG